MISFIVPALSDEPYLEKTLKSIVREIENFGRDGFEILVMLKGGLPSYLKRLEEKYDYLKVYLTEGNRSQARNEGAKLAKNHILTFVDADTEIGENFIQKTLEDFKKFAWVNYSARPLEQNKRRLYYYSKLMNFFQWLFSNANFYRPYGFCMSVRKDICEKIKLEDEIFLSKLAGYGEDSEFGKRYGKFCRKNRLRGKYESGVRVYTSMREWYNHGFWKAARRIVLNVLFVPLFKKPLIENWRKI